MKLLNAAALLCALIGSSALQAQNQTLLKELLPATPTAFDPGATVVYRVTAACNNLTGGCGNLSISDTLPAELEARSCNAPPSVNCTITGGGSGYTITKSPYNGGDTLAITLTTRVRLGQNPATNIINSATATAGNVTNPMVTSMAPPISVNGGTPNWEVRKQRVDPTGVSPAPGAPVTYRVQLCSVSGVGNVDLDNAVLVDTLPPNTTVVDAGGGTVALGPPTTVTWNLGAISLAGLYGGAAANTTQCISRLLTIAVPPPPTYNVGDPLLNSASGTITPEGGGATGIGPATVNDTLVGPVGNANPSKFGNDVAPSAGFTNISWRPTFNTNGSNVPLTDFSFVDVLPPNAPGTAGPFDLVSIRSGSWTAGDPLLGYQIVADLQTAPAPCSATTGTYATVTGGTGIANNANVLFSAGAAFPATDRCVRWVFRNVGGGPVNEVPRAFSFNTRPQIIQTVPPGEPAGTVTNCSFVRLTAGAGPAQTEGPACATENIEAPTPAIQVSKTRVGSGQIQPTTELVFRLSFNHTGNDSTGDIVNPTVADLLPANLEFVGWEAYSYSGPAAAQPYLTVTENYNGSGRTLVRFTWNPTVPAGAVTFAGAPAAAPNPASFARTIGNGDMPDMDIRVRVLPGTAAATYSNELSVFSQGAGFTCAGGGTSQVIDVDDLDVDTNVVEPRCQNNLNYTVIDAAVLLGEKWILGDPMLPNVDDPTDMITPPGGNCPDYGLTYGAVADGYTRFPCVAQTDHGGNFTYRARIQNAGNLNLDDYYLYDLLPFIGDTGSGGPLSMTARESRYQPVLTGPVSIESNSSGGSTPVVEYTTTPNPCRPEVGYTTGCNPTTYVLAGAVADFSLVTAFRIRDFVGGDFGTLELIEYSVPMRAPVSGGPPSVVGNPMIFNPSWNSFAHRAREASAGNNGPLLQVAEPPKVGIILPERYRLGNLVWRDLDNDGNAEVGEPGINGVSVSLCRDDDGSAGPSAGDTLVSSVLTATLAGQPGKYAFDTLLGGADYYLAIADGQAALTGLLSSSNGEEATPNADVDNNDNGFGAVGASCAGAAIRSGLVQLGLTGTTEPTTEVLRAGSATDDDNDGNPVYADALSNYSVDFGFVPLTDLGDLPDSGAGVGAGNYETLLANGGARHTIVPGLRFGACNDAEINGAPNVAANGDDGSASFFTDGSCAVAGDDEDGIDTTDLGALFVFGPAQIDFTATNLTATTATACGYLDFNNDGSFTGAEIATVSVPAATNNGTFSFNFGAVPVGANGTRYARFRINNDGTPCSTANANGDALSGEIEDYVTVIALPTDLGDLPDAYGTLISSNGARHPARPNLQLGACFDAEADGQPGMMALGDDTGAGTFTQGTCAVANDDEDGVLIADLNQQVGAPATLRVDVINNTGVAAQLCGFVDWNGNSSFADTVGGTPESASVPVPNGTAATLALNFGSVPQQATIGVTYARVRLSTDLGACSAVGAAPDGEVEDYLITITATDLGDLPDPTYPTLLASSGAVHTIVPGIFLGAGVDAEIDGQPNAAATGDDLAVGDDEDGVVHPGVYGFTANELIAGRANPVQITASTAGFVNCWYDFNANGSLLDAGELVFADLPLAPGANSLSVNVPQSAAGNDVYLRCRFTSGAGQATAPTGSAPNGEVEDYVLTVVGADLGDLPDSGAGTAAGNYETLLSSAGAEHILRSDGPLFGASVDAEADGQPGVNADGDDSSGVPDDENGITVADLTFIAGSPATVGFVATNPNAATATACAYVDWNGDGDFADTVGGTPESTSVAVLSGTLNAALSFNFGTTPTSAVQDTYARFRISTGACAPNGPQVNGEVEDYPATVLLLDLGDLPDGSAGVGNGDYQTLLANMGPAHVIVPGIKLGADVDFEADGQPNVLADGDDSAGNTPDDEAAVDQAVLNALFRTGPAQVPVTAMNTGGLGDVFVCGFIDFNADGDFDDAVAGPGGYSETAGPISIADGTANTVVTLDFGTVPADAILDTYARFRISTQAACSPVGTAPNGEVEDYALNVIPLDLGDLPENGGNWATTLANNGPRHVIFPEIFLGSVEDLEVDGAPSVDADGDDLAGVDDEDGVDTATLRFIAGRTTTVNVTATNNTGAAATLCGYVDLDANDSFEPSELVSASVPDGSNALVVPLAFNVPDSVVTASSYARFRLSSDGSPCAPNGLALDGEVEDYVVELVELDLGDLPDSGAGTGAGNYQTSDSDGGPAHVIVTGMKLGAEVDSEDDGQPNVAADGDDSAGTPDDEDGVADDQLEILAGLNATIEVSAMNQAGLGDANVCGFIDYNADGDFADGGEIAGPVTVADGTANTVVMLNFGVVPLNAAQQTYARFRISTEPTCSPIGEVANGEVEDYPLVITRRDLGDLPDTGVGVGVGNYRTLLADNGAAHDIVDGLFMGAGVDQEIDGQPNAATTGDDLNGPTPDDEDGVSQTDLDGLHLGSPANISVVATNTTGASARLCGYIDHNRDGDFADSSESAEVAVPNGSNAASFVLSFGPVPINVAQGPTFARFRLQSAACAPDGLVNDGEVEDYLAFIGPGEMSLGNLVWEDADNSGDFNAESGLPGIAVTLFLDSNDDGIPDGGALSTQNTDGSGNYLFTELVPETYIVCISAPVTYISSSGTDRPFAPAGPNEPGPDPDNDLNSDDNGTAGSPVTNICADPVTLAFATEPVDDGDSDNLSNLTVDFGLLYNFDLAIRKTLAAGQPFEVNIGDNVNYTITLFNQGTVEARNITVSDYLPPGFDLADAAWAPGPNNTVSRVVAGPLAPGAQTQIGLTLLVTAAAIPGDVVNVAEISRAEDPTGATPIDKDSDEDTDPLNDGDPVDDAIDNENGDEDDSDPATVDFGIGVLGVAKDLQDVFFNEGSRYGGAAAGPTINLSFVFTLENFGTRDISAVSLIDNLTEILPPGASVEVLNLMADGALVINANYTGVGNDDLLLPSSVLPRSSTATVRLDLLIRAPVAPVLPSVNSAIASGVFPNAQPVSDVSHAGLDPDPDGDGNPGNNGDPTPVNLTGLVEVIQVPVGNWAMWLLIALSMVLLGGQQLRRRVG